MLRAVSSYLGMGGLPHVSHCLSQYFSTNLRDSTPSAMRVQPCVIGSSAGGEEDVNSGSPEGRSCPSKALGSSRVSCATRGGTLSSAALAEILPYVRGLGFVLSGWTLSKIPLVFIHPLSPLQMEKRVASCLLKQGGERVKYREYEALSLLLAFSAYADNICDLSGWGDTWICHSC